jgi:hypothetical protein
MKKSVNACILFIILIVGFFMRLQAITDSIVDTPIRADARDYMFYAYNMKYRHVYSREHPATAQLQPDAVRTPGYPVFLSVFLDEDISAASLKNILFAQAVLSTLTILLAYLVFASLLESYSTPLLVALGVAISPHLITMNIYFLSETLFCFLIVACLYFLSRPQFQASPMLSLCFGALLAAAALTRPWVNYFIFLLIVFWFFYATVFTNALYKNKTILYSGLGFFALMSVWTLRNLLSLGVMSDGTLTLNTLHHGLYPYFMYNYQPESYGFPYRFDPRSSQIAASMHSVLSEIVYRFKQSPLEYTVWYLIGKPIELFSWNNYAQGMGDVFIYPVIKNPYFDNVYFGYTHQLMQAIYPIIMSLFTLSLILVWLPRDKLKINVAPMFLGRCIALLCLYFVVVHSIGAPFPRYSIPMLPLIYGMAMFAMAIAVKFIWFWVWPERVKLLIR